MTGNIDRYQTRAGQRWRIRWDEPSPAGGRVQRSRAGFTSKREAEAALLEVRTRLSRGVTVSGDREKVGRYLERWLAGLTVAPTTRSNYATCIRRYLIPHLGHLELRELQPEHLDELYRTLERNGKGDGQGLSPKSIRHVHVAIRKALQDAYARGHVARNVADLARPPKHRATRSQNARRKAFTHDQLLTFLAAAHGHQLERLFVLIARTGMRRGEALGLRWDAVNLDTGELRVFRSVTEADGQVIEADTVKTPASERTLAIDLPTVKALRDERKSNLDRLDPDGYVFARPDGRPHRPSDVSKAFTLLCRETGLPEIGVHGLRHTYATLGLRAGMPVLTMSSRLGHSSTSVTLDVYAHALDADDRSAADLMAERVFGSRVMSVS
jgi:integrase